MARPQAIQSPDDAAAYFAAIKTGCPLTTSADLAGFCYDTILAARRRFPWFSGLEKKARAEAIQERVKRIKAAGRKGNWMADAWWLERQLPQEFGKVDRVEITLKDEAKRIAQEYGLSEEEVLAEAERIMKVRR